MPRTNMQGAPGPEQGSTRKKKKSSLSTILVVLLVLALAGGGGYLAARLHMSREQAANAARRSESSVQADGQSVQAEAQADQAEEEAAAVPEEWGSRVTVNGQNYVRKDNLRTILFMGVDNAESGTQMIGNSGRTDALMLFVLNTKDKTADMIAISRDTMVPVDVYDDNGRKLYTGDMQITMQYSYGDSGKRSAMLTERRVGEVIHGIPIDGYLALTMDGIAPIVTGLGGIKLTMNKDYSYINEAYTEGAEVTMSGKEAVRFIRYRDLEVSGSNNTRMERQGWFIQEMFKQIKNGRVGFSKLLDLADAFMNTDVDAETLKAFTDYELANTYTIPGQTIRGEDHDEFYVDDEALQELLLKVFYQPR